MFEFLSTPAFWISLIQIIGIDIILSGDNAVVIALACRSLPAKQQRLAVLFGTAGAIVLRVTLAAAATLLLETVYLKLAGSVLLLWIAIKLIAPQENGHDGVKTAGNLGSAIRTIVVADFVMSLDNVIGIAAAAKGSVLLLTLGLLISIPLIVYSSLMILKLMNRYPWIVTLGGALLGYVAGEMGVTDRAVSPWVQQQAAFLHTLVPVVSAILVVTVGKWLASRQVKPSVPVDLATGADERSKPGS